MTALTLSKALNAGLRQATSANATRRPPTLVIALLKY